MRIDVQVYHYDRRIDQVLERLRALDIRVMHLLQQGEEFMATVQEIRDQGDRVLAAIAAESNKDDAIIALVVANTALLTDLRRQLEEALAGQDPAALQAVLDQMKAAETSALANAERVTAAINAGTEAPTV